MIKRSLTLSIVLGLFVVNGMLASNPKTEGRFDIDSIVYIEEEPEIELGFDTSDYLPEGFDPYKFYFNIETVKYIESDEIDLKDSQANLPSDFNAYAYPSDVESINYIDLNDNISLDLDTTTYLPKGFDAYAR
ncbi:hypothetical protein [uncultured Kriegella sp.]|uniref:hypothetical protein n=1 Tax=uncultured Kriegella sp. TaxID=1798910 RepID=UPI0030D9280E|tara:strand:+ start:35310 stop:35708 length:399 start_codon:yes stop_codon:yes gene_type:complete